MPAPRDDHPDDPAFDDDLDPDGPSADDIRRFDRDTDACPACGTDLYDDAGVCPVCGEVLDADASKTKPMTIAVVVIVLAAFALFYLF